MRALKMKNTMNYRKWVKHFERNQENREEPDWKAPQTLRGEGLETLKKSLQQFQLGDGGGPASLIAWNRGKFLERDEDLEKLVTLWFKEEEEHSRLLGDALVRFEVDPIEEHWSFSLFCKVRQWGGVQFELYALLLTEITSHVYYQMLRRHCPDEAVKGMCKMIIRDEAGHIAFHRARLAGAGGKYGLGWELMFRVRGLVAGTVLWVNHGRALKNFGASDREFYRGIWRGMTVFGEGLRRDVRKKKAIEELMARSSLQAYVPNFMGK